MGRAVSFQALGDAFAASGLLGASQSNTSPARRSTRRSNRHKGGRRSHDEFEEDDDDHCGGDHHGGEDGAPAFKRVKGVGKPRIAYYPRVMAKIQGLGTKPMEQSLSLLRQLKYAENVIFAGRDPYAKADGMCATGSPSSGAGAASAAAAGSSPWSVASTMASASSTASSGRARRGSEDDMDGIGADADAEANLSHSDVEMILLDLL